MFLRAYPCCLLALLGCSPHAQQPPTAPPTTEPALVEPPAPARPQPDARFTELERRLLAAQRVQITFDITSRGVVEADVRGLFIVEHGKLARIEASGRLAGAQGEVVLEADARVVRGTSGSKRFEIQRPAELDAALLLGLTRMGVLHNLALLWSARPPDHADGGFAEWVVTTDHHVAEHEDDAIGFGMTVDGTPVGEATLVLDAAGWPTLREQTVQFPSGEMKVTERYEAVEITDGAPTST